MSESRNERKLLRGAFPRSLQGDKHIHSQVADPDYRQCYAVTSDQETAKRFKLITREGFVYSVPYSLLPLFILTEGKELKIITHDILATLFGRGLEVIEEYLSEEQLLWIKESPSGKDDGLSRVFIERIYIQLNEDGE